MPVPLFATLDDSRAFERRLTTRALGKHIVFYPRTQSTNDLALAKKHGIPAAACARVEAILKTNAVAAK